MKYLLLILIVFSFGCNAQNSHKREFTHSATRYCRYNKDSFKVAYKYGDGGFDDLVGIMIVNKGCKYNMWTDSFYKYCHRDTAAERKYYEEHNMHHDAEISVFKIDNKGKVLQSYPKFAGYYVIAGCYEDFPPNLVERALSLQAVIDSNNKLKKENGEFALYKYVVTWAEYDTGLDSGGLTTTRIEMRRDFRTGKEAHNFIDTEIRKWNSGIDWKMDSVLVEKRFQRSLTGEEYEKIDKTTKAYQDAMDKKYHTPKSKK